MDISETTQGSNSVSRPAAAGNAKIAVRKNQDANQLEELSKKFEGLLLHQIFKQAQQTTDQIHGDEEDEESSQDAGSEQYQSLYWTQMADVVSEQGGIGLWKTMYNQLQQQAEKRHTTPDIRNENQ